MLSRLRAVVLLMTISNLWTSCQGQTSTSDYTTSHPTSVQSNANEMSTNFQNITGLSSTILTSSVPSSSSTATPSSSATVTPSSFATVTASPSVNPLSSTVNSLSTVNTNVTAFTKETETATPANSTSQNSDSSLTTSGVNTTLIGSSTTALETSTNVNATTVNFSITEGSPENNTFANVSTTTASSLTTGNTTTLSVSTGFTADTQSTSFSTNSTTQTPSTEVTPSNSASTSSTGTSMTLSTGYSAATNQSEWAGNSKDIESSTGVVLGAIFGSLLGVALVCVAAYFLCGSNKARHFSHRRLYEETANDPVLRLDNPVDLYDATSGNSGFYNPSALEEPSYNSGRPHETIVMDDIRPR